jgi:hypothetical protein
VSFILALCLCGTGWAETEKEIITDDAIISLQTRQKIEEHSYREWVKHYQRWQKENENKQYWIPIPSGEILLRDVPVPKNPDNWKREEAR